LAKDADDNVRDAGLISAARRGVAVIWASRQSSRVLIGFCLIRQSFAIPIVCFHQSKQVPAHTKNSESSKLQTKGPMKRTLLSLACLSAFSLAALAADNEKAKPDNTATNERDRSGETKTSGDQSNSSADLKITQAIRQALMKDRELSTTAKNIKVISANGQVTLRGPVKTAQEKAKVDQIAKSAAGGAQIDDQLDVKGSK
jgi:hyperosmotically inducible protein